MPTMLPTPGQKVTDGDSEHACVFEFSAPASILNKKSR